MNACVDPVLSKYIALLENVNNQLSYSFLPLEIAVGVLAAFVAVLAIVFASILWNQSQDSKKTFATFLENLQKNADKVIEEAKTRIDSKIQEHEELLKTATGETKQEYEKELKRLKDERIKIDLAPAYTPLEVGAVPGTYTVSSILGSTAARYPYSATPLSTAVFHTGSAIEMDTKAKIEEIVEKILEKKEKKP